MASLIRFVLSNPRRQIVLSIPDLVTDMIAKLYDEGGNRTYNWFMSTRDLPTVVYNFLRTRDCFLDHFPWPAIELDLTYEHGEHGGLHILGDINWQLPTVDFFNLPVKLPTGAEDRITPAYRKSTLAEGFVHYPVEPEFLVSSKTLPHAWDSTKQCFRATIPNAGK